MVVMMIAVMLLTKMTVVMLGDRGVHRGVGDDDGDDYSGDPPGVSDVDDDDGCDGFGGVDGGDDDSGYVVDKDVRGDAW